MYVTTASIIIFSLIIGTVDTFFPYSFYWPCFSNDDCLHFVFPVCDTSVKLCRRCYNNNECKKFDSSAKCTSDLNPLSTYCDVPCTNDDKCVPMQAKCKNKFLSSKKRCKDCSGNGDCQSGLQCHSTLDFISYCGECSDDSHCPGQKCRRFQCMDCLYGGDCGTDIPCIDKKCGCSQDLHCNTTAPICNTQSQVCQKCTQNSDCASRELEKLCHSDGSCRQCFSNKDCPSHKKSCNASGICFKCESNSDCQSGEQCIDSQCGECFSNAQCTGANKVCDVGQNKCVECLNSNDCPNNPRCVDQKCIDCESDAECAPILAGTTCQSNKCLGSDGCQNNGQCTVASKPACERELCRPCKSDSDCSGPNSKCKVDSGECVACLNTFDCPSQQGCTGNVCQICTTASDCAPLVCNTGNSKCETQTCIVQADCTDPLRPNCGTGLCSLCNDNSQCQLRTDSLTVCHSASGACVKCEFNTDCPNTEYCNQNNLSDSV